MAKTRIILPTDFSESARNAVRYAVGLFGHKEVEYTLLNSYAMPHTGAELLISLTDILRLESEEGLQNERDELLKEFPCLEGVLNTRSENGALENVLNRIRKEENPDLVVMGTTGATGIVKVLWGSTTSSVLKRVHTPILTVPAETKLAETRNIALALQHDMIGVFTYPPLLLQFMEKYHANVSVISVESEPITLPASEVKAVANGVGTRAYPSQCVSVYERDPVKGILNYIDTHPTDLLVMVSREYSFVKNLFHHSSTREMAKISKVPLLVLRER